MKSNSSTIPWKTTGIALGGHPVMGEGNQSVQMPPNPRGSTYSNQEEAGVWARTMT